MLWGRLADFVAPAVVGVTGSGKGMTEVAPRHKHKFEATDEDA